MCVGVGGGGGDVKYWYTPLLKPQTIGLRDLENFYSLQAAGSLWLSKLGSLAKEHRRIFLNGIVSQLYSMNN